MRANLLTARDELRTKCEELAAMDWSFERARTQEGVHGLHPYPAKFIPQIPRQILSVMPPRGAMIVFDPFCGSGTTLVEAQSSGYEALGVDVSPLAALMARVKTRRLVDPVAPIAASVLASARNERSPIPAIPRLDHWFQPHVQQALANLTSGIRSVESPAVREALEVALSSVIVRVSNQESDTRYAAVEKAVSEETVYQSFLKAVATLDRAMQARFGGLFDTAPPHVRVLSKDILQVTPSDIGVTVGAVITSPPYPNAYEYWLYHKYRMYWLGLDPLAVKEREIGARPHYFRKDAHTERHFEEQMASVFRLLGAIMAPEAYACFVVGTSVIRGRVVDNATLLKAAGRRHGFMCVASIDRRIASTRKAFNPANGRIESESILFFAR